MQILGINQCEGIYQFAHDTGAALICDGEIVAVAEEERFNRQKHTKAAPHSSIEYCLGEANITISDVDLIAVANRPSAFFRNWREDHHPLSLMRRGALALSTWWYWVNQAARYQKKLIFVGHHHAHASVGYYTSGYDDANVLVIDGAGESETFSFYVARNGQLKLITRLFLKRRNLNSIGQMYSDVSVVLGFGKNGEGKTMGLSSYGLPTYDFSTAFLFTSFNNYTLDRQKLLSCIDHIRSMNSEPDFSQDQKNLAASIQSSMEDAVVTLAREAFRLSGIENFVLVGGVALNCKANERLLNQSFCKSLYVPPVPNDSGNALGSALYGAHISGYTVRSSLHHAYWGPSYSNDEVEDELRKADLFYHKYDSIIEEAAQLISTGKVIGWFQGRMEIGPRALGNRSILADPTRRGINDRVNQIKMRDKWRPFAPAVTADDAGRYFLGFDKIQSSPFMSFSMKLRESFQEDLPAVTHIDGRCRVQTVALEQNPSFFSLLKAMERRNGHPMLLNTSFNIGNEPIVCTPTQAISSFCCSDLDALVMGNFLVLKKILYGKIHGDCILS